MGEFVSLPRGETVVGLATVDGLGRADWRSAPRPGWSSGSPRTTRRPSEFEVIALRDGDRVVGAVQLTSEDQDLVFITSDAQLLRFGAAAVRPQGRSAGGWPASGCRGARR